MNIVEIHNDEHLILINLESSMIECVQLEVYLIRIQLSGQFGREYLISFDDKEKAQTEYNKLKQALENKYPVRTAFNQMSAGELERQYKSDCAIQTTILNKELHDHLNKR